jgi:hypothetical protein
LHPGHSGPPPNEFIGVRTPFHFNPSCILDINRTRAPGANHGNFVKGFRGDYHFLEKRRQNEAAPEAGR